jgi:hypothetical protein
MLTTDGWPGNPLGNFVEARFAKRCGVYNLGFAGFLTKGRGTGCFGDNAHDL